MIELVRHFAAGDKPIASVCHGQQILAAAGVLEGKRCTAYPAVRPEVERAGGTWCEVNETVSNAYSDGNLVTAPAWPAHPEWMRRFSRSAGHPNRSLMRHLVFVYGTLLRGEVNHRLLAEAEYLGPHRTASCFSLYLLGAYPGAVRGGGTALQGEVYAVDHAGLRRLDQLEDYPTLYDRRLLATPYGRTWIYLFRGSVRDRPVIPGGDWRSFVADPDSIRAAGVRRARDPRPAARCPATAGRKTMRSRAIRNRSARPLDPSLRNDSKLT